VIFEAVILVCTVIPGKPASDDRCMHMRDAIGGPYATLDQCHEALKRVGPHAVQAAAYQFAASSMKYSGPIRVAVNCAQKKGKSA